MLQRRSQIRSPDCGLVTVHWQRNLTQFSQIGNIRDISQGGIGILVRDSLPIGTAVTISFRGSEAKGIVKHSSQIADSPWIGVAYSELIDFHPAIAA
jgi:c-di-GMP-binding flagellar brake protein YcgR